jgi:hypothetical protein
VRIRSPSLGPYRLFLSSSNDPPLQRLRARVKALVEEVVNPQLISEYPEAGVSIALEIWERVAAQQAHGDSVNEIFVEKARNSQLTLVLLHDQLKKGTREELDAAIAAGVEVSLLCFEPPKSLSHRRQAQLRRDIRRYESHLFYGELGPPLSNDAWIGLTRVLLAFTFASIRDSQLPGGRELVAELR